MRSISGLTAATVVASAIIISLLLPSTAAPSALLIQTSEAFPSKSNPHRLFPSTVALQPAPAPGIPLITLDPSSRFQTLWGFGGAITDAVAHVFSRLNATLQQQVVDDLWGAGGQRYNLGRLTIGSTDFSTTVYNYNDSPLDFEQGNFSIKHDEHLIIPLAIRAQQAASAGGGDGLQFMSSSWSPPGWMKVPYGIDQHKGTMRNSAKPGMLPDDDVHAAYALYLSKYIQAYTAAGVNVTMMTIQNEPDTADRMFPVSYPCCNFNGTDEGSFLLKHLGPLIRTHHPSLRIFIHDGQKFGANAPIADRVKDIIAAAGGDLTYVDGVAFHWYGANLQNYQYLAALHEQQPSLPLLGTEATLMDPKLQHIGTSPWKEAQKYAVDIIGDLNAFANGWIEWNVLLDSSGGPTCIGPTDSEICTPLIGHCDAPILADLERQTLEYRDTFYIMAHFSRFLPKGSVRIAASSNGSSSGSGSSSGPLPAYTAFSTPSGDIVLVLLNSDDAATASYQVELGGVYAVVPSMPPHTMHTLILPPPQRA